MVKSLKGVLSEFHSNELYSFLLENLKNDTPMELLLCLGSVLYKHGVVDTDPNSIRVSKKYKFNKENMIILVVGHNSPGTVHYDIHPSDTEKIMRAAGDTLYISYSHSSAFISEGVSSFTENVFKYPAIKSTSFLDHVSFVDKLGQCQLRRIFSEIVSETESSEFLDAANKVTINMRGRSLSLKARKQVSYGEYSHYTGSNYKLNMDMFPALEELTNIANDHMHSNYPETEGYSLNSIVVIRYDDSENYIGHHSDGTLTLHDDSPIYSFSIGATRMFEIAEKSTKFIIASIPVEDCHCYIMRGKFQKELTHAIPQVKKSAKLSPGFRVNVTMRCVDVKKSQAQIKKMILAEQKKNIIFIEE